jgi:hypothetical protein
VPARLRGAIETPDVALVLRGGRPVLIAVVLGDEPRIRPRQIEPADACSPPIAEVVLEGGLRQVGRAREEPQPRLLPRLGTDADELRRRPGTADSASASGA